MYVLKENELLEFTLREMLIPDTNPLKEEFKILNYFRKHWTNNPRKLIGVLNKYLAENEVSTFILNGIVKPIVSVNDPVRYLASCFEDQIKYADMVKEMFVRGYHGFITTGNNVYGVYIESDEELNINNKYTPEEEYELEKALVYEWSKTYHITHSVGKILLFTDYGFSGISRAFTNRDIKRYKREINS